MGSGQLPVQAHSAAARCSALNNAIKDEVHSRTAQTTILATGSAFALLMAALGDHAHGEGNLRRDLYDLIRAPSWRRVREAEEVFLVDRVRLILPS